MKRNFTEMLCIRGAGAYKAGVCYPAVGVCILVMSTKGVLYGFTANPPLSSGGGKPHEILHGGEQTGARFVEVKRCKRKSG